VQQAPPSPAPPRRDPWRWYTQRLPPAVSLVLPVALAPLPIVAAWWLLPQAVAQVAQVTVLTPFAMDVAIGVGVAYRLAWWLIAGIVLWVQLLLLLWVVRNIELLRAWRRLDGFLRRQEVRAARVYQRRAWMRRFHFVGIMVFVFLPVNSGVFTGVILGKLTGMSDRRLVGAIYTGTVLWVVLLTLAGTAAEFWIRRWFF
jgi:uncharacterized membrane protein